MFPHPQTILPGRQSKNSSPFPPIPLNSAIFYSYFTILFIPPFPILLFFPKSNNFIFFYSFPLDSALVIDAAITVTVFPRGKPTEIKTESLFPNRHQIALPVNGMNFLFEDCSSSFNHSLKLDTDR